MRRYRRPTGQLSDLRAVLKSLIWNLGARPAAAVESANGISNGGDQITCDRSSLPQMARRDCCRGCSVCPFFDLVAEDLFVLVIPAAKYFHPAQVNASGVAYAKAGVTKRQEAANQGGNGGRCQYH